MSELLPKFDERHNKLVEEVAELKEPEEEEKKELDEMVPTDVSHLKGQKGVPDFWFKVMKTSSFLKQAANEKDWEALESLVDVDCIPSNEGKASVTTLKFTFKADNDFFKNTVLEVKCWLEDGTDQTMVKKTEASEIEWLEGKDTTKKKIKKKQKHKKTGETRTVMKTVDAESFFGIFQNLEKPKDADEDDEDAQKIEEKLDFVS